MRRFFTILGYTLIIIFALIGLVTTSVFVAMRFDLLNVRGSIDDRNQFFLDAYQNTVSSKSHLLEKAASETARVVSIITTNGLAAANSATSTAEELLSNPCVDPNKNICNWTETPEWFVIEGGLLKDDTILNRVEAETGVKKRLIAAVVLPEQARFFSSNREVFKRWFEPMKLLGSMSQFSLGVSGIKQETAKRIEENANDATSPFYPGADMSDLVKYSDGANTADELFKRLTDEKDHYYSYLYTALFIKEVTAQWALEGQDISERPEVIVTLFNLGFEKSKPHANPTAGGATLNIGNTNYTYGTLGGFFYYSDELTDTFPR
ncbi:MAG: hypothetical protein RLZZ230_550 [Candidatus Parcubacteria bacterium]|jgi:hypothetical protein